MRKVRSACAILLAACSIQAATNETTSPPRAAIFYDNLPGQDQAFAREIAAQVGAAGYSTELVFLPVLTNHASLTAKRYDLLVLPNARTLPVVTAPVIDGYLREGGDLLALGVPAWQSPAFQLNGKWLSREEYDKTLAAQRPTHIVETFGQTDLSQWKRSAGDASGKAQYEIAPSGKIAVLHAIVAHLGGWDTFMSPALPAPFATNNTLTCFRARGGPHTRQLALEWREQDGSRWIATADLKTNWQDYVLTPDRFKAWPPGAVSEDRRFNPARAVSFTVGLALSHTALEGDAHEYWFSDLGTAPNPFGPNPPPEEADLPILDSISPSYQCYPIAGPLNIITDPLRQPREPLGDNPANLARSDEHCHLALQPRARGLGFNQSRAYRWEPLLGAFDPPARLLYSPPEKYRGAVAALVMNLDEPYRGSVWAAFTPSDAGFYRLPVATSTLRQVLGQMKRGLFLAEGGSEFLTLFPEQPFTVGARVVNFSRQRATNLLVTILSFNQDGSPSRPLVRTNFTLTAGGSIVLSRQGLQPIPTEEEVGITLSQFTGKPATLPQEGSTNSAYLKWQDFTIGDTTIDGFSQPIGMWHPSPTPQFIQSRDGGFWLNGKPWKVNGVNYMPSSGIGLANYRYFEHWLGRGAYDPAVIQRDLLRIKAMNLNAVSIFIDHQSLDSQHLLDFLRRCQDLGLHVNLSLRPGSPMQFHWEQMKEIIKHYQLAENDTVFAYDIAWEPSHGGQAEQRRDYAGLWHQWVLRKYETLAAATNAWGFPAPKLIRTPRTTLSPISADFSALSMDVPTMAQLTTDGPWRKMVADYRLCLDEILHSRYAAARELIRSVDPHHAVSFRMSNAGDPLYNWDAALAYDFYGLKEAVDIWEPEAYGRIGDWPRVRAGDFTAAYARLCDPAKPILWAEMGFSVWDMHRMAPDPQKLAWEAGYYSDFYRMLTESGCDGVFFWWYPGGFRVGENSDFGIINPDGTDRPVTKVIRTEGPRFLAAPKPSGPRVAIPVNRDKDARGLYGIYEAAQSAFWKATDGGRIPELRYEHVQEQATPAAPPSPREGERPREP